MPTLKSYTLASRTKPPHKAKLAKEYVFPTHNERMNTPYNNVYEVMLPIGRTPHIHDRCASFSQSDFCEFIELMNKDKRIFIM